MRAIPRAVGTATASASASGGAPVAAARIVTTNEAMRGDLLRLCAAAGLPADPVDDPPSTASSSWHADVLLLGTDLLSGATFHRYADRGSLVVVASSPLTGNEWALALELGVRHVFELPADEARLVEWLGEVVDGIGRRALTIGVVGAHGGAGASTLAAALALTGAADGDEALLVDTDPMAGGIDLAVGCEEVPGLRWRQMSATQGRVSAAAFRAALPQVGSLAVLSFDREPASEPRDDTAGQMLAAGRRCAGCVVVDLGRAPVGPWAGLAAELAVVLVVARTDVRAAAAARLVVASWRHLCQDIRIVARHQQPAALDADALAECAGAPLAVVLPTRRAIARAVDEGRGPLAHRGYERMCRELLDGLRSRS